MAKNPNENSEEMVAKCKKGIEYDREGERRQVQLVAETKAKQRCVWI